MPAAEKHSIGDDFFRIAVLFVRRNTTLVLFYLNGQSIVGNAIRKLEGLVASRSWAFVELGGHRTIPFNRIR